MDLDLSAWFAGKRFSTDWTSRFFAQWAVLLEARRHELLEVLEIGSWEGRSAIFFLRFLENCRLTCIDTFAGNPEHHLRDKWRAALPQIEQRFDANLAEFGARVHKIKDTSLQALAGLAAAGRRFDVVLVDGSHHSADVLADATQCWPLVRDGGLVIFDDYEWTFFDDPVRHPRQGVDRFLASHAGHYRELHRGYQVIIEKVGVDRRVGKGACAEPEDSRRGSAPCPPEQAAVGTLCAVAHAPSTKLCPPYSLLRRAKIALALAAVALAGLFLAAMPWRMPSAGLDPSWNLALEYAWRHGLVFGRDFSFTSGPLSFIYTRLFHPETFLWIVLAMIHVTAVYLAVVWWSPQRRLSVALLGLLALCAAPLNPDALYFSLPLAVFLLSLRAVPAGLMAALIAGLALASLAKFSVLLLALPLLLLADALALAERRKRCWHAAIYAASVIAVYCAAGQPLGAFADFLAGSLDVAAGYGAAMANFGWTGQQTVLVLACAALLAGAFALMPRGRAAFACLLALAWYCFVAFKLGNVRAGHQASTWHALAAAGFLLVLLPCAAPRRLALVGSLAILLAAATAHMLRVEFEPRVMAAERAGQIAAFAQRTLAWLDPVASFARLSAQRRDAEQRLAAQAPRDLAGTTGSLPWEFSELIAAGARFVPAPSLQAYANYTPRLRAATTRHFAVGARPDNLFLSLVGIDGRFRTMDLGPALLGILSDYDLVRARSRIAGAPPQLRRRARPRQAWGWPLADRVGRLEQWIDAPTGAAGGLMLALRVRETVAGRLLTLAYKQEPLWLDLRFASGTVSARAFPNLVSDGFLVLPPEVTEAQLFLGLTQGLPSSNPLLAFRLRASRLGAWRFAADYHFDASAIGIAGPPEHPLAEEPPAATAMQALIAGRVIAGPQVRVIPEGLLAHAPSTIVATMPKGRRLAGTFGFLDGAWRDGNPGAVTFAISRVTPVGARRLFARTLDPKRNPADRGMQAFAIELAEGEAGELLFETGPGTDWGWTVWSGLRMEE
jgi:predicted O-methyltransferase YrrM